MRRQLVALAVVALAVTAGCTGATGPSQEQLARDVDYEWTHETAVAVNVTGTEYRTVASVDGERSVTLAYSGGLGGRSAVSVSAVKFRYPNGTVVGADAISVERSGDSTVVELPADNGTFAYTASTGSGSVSVPVVFDGSHEVVLPPGTRVALPVFGSVSPGGYEKTVVDERVHLTWSSTPEGNLSVQYYLQQDLHVFAAIVAVLFVVALGGVVYFRLQIRSLESDREEVDLDVERE